MGLPAAARVSAQTGALGKIEGQVLNGTKDAMLTSATGLTVTLHMVAVGATSTISTTTKTDANGRFTFSNLDTISTTRYLALTNYGGVDYFSDVLSFGPPNTATLPALITIHDTTTDPSVIKVTQTHFVMDVHTRAFGVLEIVALQNTSDRAYVGTALAGPHRATLALPVLPGASNVTFERPGADDTTLRGDDVLTYTLPIPPGNDQIVFNYAVSFTPPTYLFNLKLPFDTAKFGILLADVGGTIQSQQLSTAAPFPTQGGQKFLLTSADDLKAGTVVSATIASLPAVVNEPASSGSTASAPNAPADNAQLFGLAVLGIAGLAAVALLLYPMLRRRATQSPSLPGDSRRRALLQEIADLDDEFEAGKISEADYKEQRAALKARLLKMGDGG